MEPLNFSENEFERLEDFTNQLLDYQIKLPHAPSPDQFLLHLNKWIRQDKASYSDDSTFFFIKENLIS